MAAAYALGLFDATARPRCTITCLTFHRQTRSSYLMLIRVHRGNAASDDLPAGDLRLLVGCLLATFVLYGRRAALNVRWTAIVAFHLPLGCFTDFIAVVRVSSSVLLFRQRGCFGSKRITLFILRMWRQVGGDISALRCQRKGGDDKVRIRAYKRVLPCWNRAKGGPPSPTGIKAGRDPP